MIFKNILFFIISFSFFTCLPPSTFVKNILGKHAEAMGGKEQWANLTAYQRTTTRPNGSTVIVTCLMPDKITLEFQKDTFNLTKGYDGAHGYIVRNGTYEAMRPGEAIEMAEEPAYYSELMFALDEGHEVEYLGEEQVEGIDCYKLAVRKSEQDEQIYWLNSTNYLIEQTGEYSEDKAHEGIYYKTRWTDYRAVDGYMFPFEEALIPSNRAPIVSKVKAMTVNESMTLADFSFQPKNTANLIRYWQDRYQEQQLQAFTFVQETIRFREETSDTSTWYEAIQYPDHFRMDFGDKENLNRNLYRNDSIYVMRKGEEVHRGSEIQEFMIMEGSLYTSPVDTTLAKLRAVGTNPDLFYQTEYKGRSVFVIGAEAEDYQSSQVWLDTERRYTVRRFSQLSDGRLMEVTYDDFKLIDGHHIESWLEFYLDGKLFQTERYQNIQVNPQLDSAIFDPSLWKDHYWY